MSNAYERMRALLEECGLTFSEHGITNAEIYAYSKALELLEASLESIEKEIFISDEYDSDISRYAYLFGLDLRHNTPEEVKSAILRRFGYLYGGISVADLRADFALVGSGTYRNSGVMVTFSDVELKDLKALGSFISAYIPLYFGIFANGDGMTFDEWDETEFTFDNLDSFNLQFYYLDTMRSENIEQY